MACVLVDYIAEMLHIINGDDHQWRSTVPDTNITNNHSYARFKPILTDAHTSVSTMATHVGMRRGQGGMRDFREAEGCRSMLGGGDITRKGV